jgi:hypothetical protein
MYIPCSEYLHVSFRDTSNGNFTLRASISISKIRAKFTWNINKLYCKVVKMFTVNNNNYHLTNGLWAVSLPKGAMSQCLIQNTDTFKDGCKFLLPFVKVTLAVPTPKINPSLHIYKEVLHSCFLGSPPKFGHSKISPSSPGGSNHPWIFCSFSSSHVNNFPQNLHIP